MTEVQGYSIKMRSWHGLPSIWTYKKFDGGLQRSSTTLQMAFKETSWTPRRARTHARTPCSLDDASQIRFMALISHPITQLIRRAQRNVGIKPSSLDGARGGNVVSLKEQKHICNPSWFQGGLRTTKTVISCSFTFNKREWMIIFNVWNLLVNVWGRKILH